MTLGLSGVLIELQQKAVDLIVSQWSKHFVTTIELYNAF